MNAVIEAARPDFAAIKQKQQATWASGDFAVVGTTLQIVGESLAEAVDVRAGERVLDVAAGNGNATLAAARRFAEVTSTDYVPALRELERLLKPHKHRKVELADKTVANAVIRMEKSETYGTELINQLEDILNAVHSHAEREVK